MTYSRALADSDSVNLGSNPSSPATNNANISRPETPLPAPATCATSGNGQRTSDAQESAHRRELLWAGMDYLIGRLHDAGMHPSGMTDIAEWWAAWTRDPNGTVFDRPAPKATRETP